VVRKQNTNVATHRVWAAVCSLATTNMANVRISDVISRAVESESDSEGIFRWSRSR
jgi:hypothetical protein